MLPISLDQLHVFMMVAEEGSFSAAAKKLHRAQSAVSYAISNLERLLDVELFDRSTRTPTLTDAGRALLKEVRLIVENVDRLTARAKQMAGGIEARVTLAVDPLFPMGVVLDALAAFRQKYADLPVTLRTEALGAALELVLDGTVGVAICSPLPDVPATIVRGPSWTVPLVVVTGPAHPLAAAQGPVSDEQLRAHLQLVVTDRSTLSEGQQSGVVSQQNWYFADLATKHECLRHGFGWGNMPYHMVAEDLGQGRLHQLALDGPGRESTIDVELSVVHLRSDPPGQATRWLIDEIGRAYARAAEAGLTAPA